jgi:hypothetical protein
VQHSESNRPVARRCASEISPVVAQPAPLPSEGAALLPAEASIAPNNSPANGAVPHTSDDSDFRDMPQSSLHLPPHDAGDRYTSQRLPTGAGAGLAQLLGELACSVSAPTHTWCLQPQLLASVPLKRASYRATWGCQTVGHLELPAPTKMCPPQSAPITSHRWACLHDHGCSPRSQNGAALRCFVVAGGR